MKIEATKTFILNLPYRLWSRRYNSTVADLHEILNIKSIFRLHISHSNFIHEYLTPVTPYNEIINLFTQL